jgi:lipopolysaccharide transport system ATP-binding protein
MNYIEVKNVSVHFPVFDVRHRSLKSTIKIASTGGLIFGEDSKKYFGIKYIQALDNLSFRVEEGSRIGIFGHNGSGKSTLLKVLAGIYPPTLGKITVNGSIGAFIDIAAGVDGDLSGYDNIYIRGLMMGRSLAEINQEVNNIIDFAGLGEFINMPIRTYSSGMWARLVFSIVTSFQSDIILLDEWLSVGDEIFQKKAQARLISVVNKSSILVLASQSINLLQSKCTDIIMLEHGKILRNNSVNNIV